MLSAAWNREPSYRDDAATFPSGCPEPSLSVRAGSDQKQQCPSSFETAACGTSTFPSYGMRASAKPSVASGVDEKPQDRVGVFLS